MSVDAQAFSTAITNLNVIPQTNGVSLSFNTGTAVCAQLQIGTASGTYTQKFTVESVPRTVHQMSGYGLQPNTTYHYILQFYDGVGNLLDATTDATFVTLAAPAAGSGQGVLLGLPGQSLIGGSGVPPATLGSDGSFYFRWDGTAGSFIYHRTGGAWTAVI